MEFYCYSPSETFVVLTADQFVGRDDGLLQQQRQDSHVCRKIRTFPLILRRNQEKSESSLQRRRSLRNCMQRACCGVVSIVHSLPAWNATYIHVITDELLS